MTERVPIESLARRAADGDRQAFDELAGIYGPRDYLKIVEEQINFWTVASLEGLSEVGKRAQEKILGIPKRLERVADAMETRSRAKTFSFAVAFAREFSMT